MDSESECLRFDPGVEELVIDFDNDAGVLAIVVDVTAFILIFCFNLEFKLRCNNGELKGDNEYDKDGISFDDREVEDVDIIEADDDNDDDDESIPLLCFSNIIPSSSSLS